MLQPAVPQQSSARLSKQLVLVSWYQQSIMVSVPIPTLVSILYTLNTTTTTTTTTITTTTT